MSDIPLYVQEMLKSHPCYNEKAHKEFARMHLPIAPRCNIQCNYCNRKYDCTNESRPGVTSEVLSPEEAVNKIRVVKEKIPQLSVIGIAGPGDPLANEETFTTLELVKEEFPELTLCLSTNGLNLPRSVERLKALGVKFVTVTINAVDPEVGSKIYDFAIWDGKLLRGKDAAEQLLKNQLEGIKMCTEAGILVKANIVMVPTVNADHIPDIAKKVKELGAYIVNIIPLIPVPGTRFEHMPAPTPEQRKMLQDLCEGDIRQMRHCRFCRADAIGMLDNDRSAEFAHITCGAREAPQGGPVGIQMEGTAKHRVAVATSDGKNVDQHFGQTKEFWLFDVEDGKLKLVDKVRTDPFLEESMFGPKHHNKIERMVSALIGSDIVLTSGFGVKADAEIRARGMRPYKKDGPLDEAVLCAVRDLFEERAKVFE
ncbi:MAG TPA: nitrogenase cofactor biosynthesis protein NifB [Methanomassiliicoccales archaeon]|nr:nitrogenase cofactor biosynthesis protein NifB [Methanomassiliicoccales archaeon]HPR98255.1 nitrogenase cofactor biosynthesis protein NifB [Methanomassiliicoccales archaeon]